MNVHIGIDRFLAINLAGLVLFIIGTVFAYRNPRTAWICVSLAALVGVNAIVHTVSSFVLGSYSPGTVTGLLLYIPLCVIIFRWAAAHQPYRVVIGSIIFGVGFHAVATLSAIQ